MNKKAAIACICLVLLAALTASLPEPFAFEDTLIRRTGAMRNTATLALADLLHNIGHYGAWLVAALAAMYLACRQWRSALFVTCAAALASGSTALLKIAVNRVRPDILDHLVRQTDASFPSGHSTFAATLATVLILLYPKAAVWVAGIGLILAMGWSRLLLGVHYPTDVVAGWCVGIAVPLLLAACFPNLIRRRLIFHKMNYNSCFLS